MNKWLKIIIGLAIFGIIVAGIGYKFIYNKPHKDYEKARPDYSLTSQALFFEYQNNKVDAQQNYNGKVIEISGYLNKVETHDSMTIAVFVMDEGIFGDEGIRCTMLPNHSENILLYAEKEVNIKGYCAGYNDTDVILEKCSIVK
jgi:hypothetical protein